MYKYKCKIIHIVDGDTVDVDIFLGFDVVLSNQRIRINGIDTPESRTSNKVEKLFGIAAKQRVQELLPLNEYFTLISTEFKGKFGRILGDIMIDDVLLTAILLREHQAVKYSGNSKASTKQEHLKNRQILLNENIVSLSDYNKAIQ